MYHDGQSGPASSCDADDGLMGYGDEHSTFSTCSLDSMESYFNGRGYGMSCLSSGWDHDFVSNMNNNGQPNMESTCPGFDCIYLTGFNNNWENHEGYYSPSGSCHDDHRYYIGPNDEYLCYDNSMSRWFLSWTLCENPFAMSSTTGGDVTSANYWMISYRGSFYSTPDMYISSCDGNQAFNDDSTCLDENPLDDLICVSTQSNLWSSDRTFLLFDELCLNDKPVYHFVKQNDSSFIEYEIGNDTNDTIILEEIEETTFYLHYQLMEIDVSGNETIGLWMLTQDEISTNYLAFCEEEELEDCTEGNWYIQTLFISHDNKTQGGDGYIDDVIDEFMTITNGRCDSALVDGEGNGSDDGDSTSTMIVLVVLCVVMLLVLLCVVPFCIRRWIYCGGERKGKEAVSDMEEDVVEQEPENIDMSLEVEVEVNLSKDTTDGDITNTRD